MHLQLLVASGIGYDSQHLPAHKRINLVGRHNFNLCVLPHLPLFAHRNDLCQELVQWVGSVVFGRPEHLAALGITATCGFSRGLKTYDCV